jgi:hypothetical protein
MNKIPMSVRFVYLVSADRTENNEYTEAIENAAKSLQTWYKNQMNGLTFTLNTPVVEIIQSDKNASYFYSNPSNEDQDNWGFYNGFNEVSRILDAKFNDDNYRWVIYSDGPGDKGRGGSGVCVMPENDLIGLIKEYPEKNRWIGGGGHELGHAFGLNDTKLDYNALMGHGFYEKYPNETYLIEEDKGLLINSPFFKTIRYYSEGIFEHSSTQNCQWKEYKNTNNDIYNFTEYMSDESFYYLQATDRNFYIKLPKGNGMSFTSVDNGNTWSEWYTFNS